MRPNTQTGQIDERKNTAERDDQVNTSGVLAFNGNRMELRGVTGGNAPNGTKQINTAN